MTDEELLIKYRKYKKRRNFIIVISFLFALILGLFLFNKLANTKIDNDEEQVKKENVKEEIDITPPILTLNNESIEITEGDKIDYKSYIKSAIDDVDGDITDKVLYFEIDSAKIGESEIVYYVLDNSNNMAQARLKVLVKEKPKEIVENNPVEDQNQNKSNTTTNNNNDSKQSENKPKESEKIIKYFLFSDGYTMNNVVDACANELKKLNRAGSCTPLTDSSGIYLGMKLETN